MARLLLDEDIKSRRLVRLLRDAGHDVVTTADLGLDGQPDETILRKGGAEGRIVLTYNCDDFRALHEASADHAGVLLVYQETGKSPSHEQIVRALGNLVDSGAVIVGRLFALNAWQY